MVGRLELLTPEREQLAERAVRDLASTDAATASAPSPSCATRAATSSRWSAACCGPPATSRSRGSATSCLLTDWVTELRAAVHSATTGERVREEPAYVRAQLGQPAA